MQSLLPRQLLQRFDSSAPAPSGACFVIEANPMADSGFVKLQCLDT